MIQVERTGSGLCGETRLSHGTNILRFDRDADVSLTDHGILAVERGLAAVKTTYLLDGNIAASGTLVAKCHAVRIHLEYRHNSFVRDFAAKPGHALCVTKHNQKINIWQGIPSALVLLEEFPVVDVKAIVAEESIVVPAPLPQAVSQISFLAQSIVAWLPRKALGKP